MFVSDLIPAFPHQRQFLLHLSCVARCLGDLASLHVPLSQQLLNVLLFLLQSFLQRSGARNLAGVPSGGLCQLNNGSHVKVKHLAMTHAEVLAVWTVEI